MDQAEIQKLKEDWGLKKFFPSLYEVAALKALSHYPELKQANIRIISRRHSFFLYSSRPSFTSLFRSPGQRKYLVFIQEEAKSSVVKKALLRNLPLDAQVGVLGHEFAHIADYTKRNMLSLLLLALLYFLPFFRKKLERSIDCSVIQHGLRNELYIFASYLRSIRGFIEDNKWIEKYYLQPEEILKADSHC